MISLGNTRPTAHVFSDRELRNSGYKELKSFDILQDRKVVDPASHKRVTRDVVDLNGDHKVGPGDAILGLKLSDFQQMLQLDSEARPLVIPDRGTPIPACLDTTFTIIPEKGKEAQEQGAIGMARTLCPGYYNPFVVLDVHPTYAPARPPQMKVMDYQGVAPWQPQSSGPCEYDVILHGLYPKQA